MGEIRGVHDYRPCQEDHPSSRLDHRLSEVVSVRDGVRLSLVCPPGRSVYSNGNHAGRRPYGAVGGQYLHGLDL